jgi:hypothetical protein
MPMVTETVEAVAQTLVQMAAETVEAVAQTLVQMAAAAGPRTRA